MLLRTVSCSCSWRLQWCLYDLWLDGWVICCCSPNFSAWFFRSSETEVPKQWWEVIMTYKRHPSASLCPQPPVVQKRDLWHHPGLAAENGKFSASPGTVSRRLSTSALRVLLANPSMSSQWQEAGDSRVQERLPFSLFLGYLLPTWALGHQHRLPRVNVGPGWEVKVVRKVGSPKASTSGCDIY